MQLETKNLNIESMNEEGRGLARLALLSAVDSDGDTYVPGAFGWKEHGEQWAPMLPAHDRHALPLGKVRVFEKDGAAYADLHLNLDTVAGREWHSHLKFDLKTGKPAQEWSYGYGVVDAESEQRGGDRVRVLKQVDVHEVSPVVRGAGFGTATVSMKSHGNFAEQIDAVIAELDDIVARAGGIATLRAGQGRDMSKARLEQLAAVKAKLDEMLRTDPAPAADGALAEKMAAEFLTRAARRRLGIG